MHANKQLLNSEYMHLNIKCYHPKLILRLMVELLVRSESSLTPDLCPCSSAPEQGTSASLPSSCQPCRLWLRSLPLLTVTDEMSMWMYANVIFVVHYSLKDRSWTISFPFMRLPCWPAEWRYSNYSFPRPPASLCWVCVQRCCTAAKCERGRGISQDSRGGAEQL